MEMNFAPEIEQDWAGILEDPELTTYPSELDYDIFEIVPWSFDTILKIG